MTQAQGLTPRDLDELHRRGMPPARIERQIEQLEAWDPWIEVERPARLGDGIISLQDFDQAALVAAAKNAAQAGRIGAFVPASGDATRLFERLAQASNGGYASLAAAEAAAHAGDQAAIELVKIVQNLNAMAVGLALKAQGLDAASPLSALMDALAGPGDSSLARLPKGLIPFHIENGAIRTAVAEHLLDAASLGARQMLMTSQTQHLAKFETAFVQQTEETTAILHRLDLPAMTMAVQIQNPAFDAIALNADGELLRDDHGNLVFRPGGHGVLIHNLNAMNGDIVTIRNIDNVVTHAFKTEGHTVRQAMIGFTVNLQRAIFQAFHAIMDGAELETALAPLAGRLPWDAATLTGDNATRRAQALNLLNRPLRVCGMVQDLDHKGGGPFWVLAEQGPSLQIVEGANLTSHDPQQAEIIGKSTHFHPVDMVLGLKDPHGQPYDLTQFIDEHAVILTAKTRNGAPIKAFEYPGLWNGSMSHWNTVFVDIPATMFNPVKYLSDLLTKYHRSN